MAALNSITHAFCITDTNKVVNCFVNMLDWHSNEAVIIVNKKRYTVPRHNVFYDFKRAQNELAWRQNKPKKR